MKKIMILVLLAVMVLFGAVPAAQAHKPKHHRHDVYHYVPAPCPPPAVVHRYYPYAGYRYVPPPPPRRVDVYHYYYSCYPYCGYYPAPRRPYVGGYVGDAGWSLIFETGGRW